MPRVRLLSVGKTDAQGRNYAKMELSVGKSDSRRRWMGTMCVSFRTKPAISGGSPALLYDLSYKTGDFGGILGSFVRYFVQNRRFRGDPRLFCTIFRTKPAISGGSPALLYDISYKTAISWGSAALLYDISYKIGDRAVSHPLPAASCNHKNSPSPMIHDHKG